MEIDVVLLPESFGMDGTPSEHSLRSYFFLELINGGESLRVLIEELKHLVKEVGDVSVNPVSVL